jgi:flagellar basal-body rod modification protein FlgD
MDVRNTTPIDGVASAQSNYEKYKDMFSDKHDLITMENFYSLLVAEMQNQDPLEPTSNTEFISQMASFTALSAQQDAFNVQQQNYANSLIGKTVTVSTGDGKTDTGVVSFVRSGDDPQINVNGNNYSLSAISQVHSGDQQTSAIGDYGAFAAGILGRNAVVQAVDSTGTTYVDEGTVSALEIQNGEVRVVVNGYAYNATDVLKVTENTASAGTAAVNDTENTVQKVQSAAVTDEDDIADAAENDDDSEIYELFE